MAMEILIGGYNIGESKERVKLIYIWTANARWYIKYMCKYDIDGSL